MDTKIVMLKNRIKDHWLEKDRDWLVRNNFKTLVESQLDKVQEDRRKTYWTTARNKEFNDTFKMQINKDNSRLCIVFIENVKYIVDYNKDEVLDLVLSSFRTDISNNRTRVE